MALVSLADQSLISLVGVVGHMTTGNELWLIVLLLMFFMAPLLDWLLGEDQASGPGLAGPTDSAVRTGRITALDEPIGCR